MIQLFGQYENRKCGKGWKKDMIFKRMHNKPFAFFDSHVFIVLPIANSFNFFQQFAIFDACERFVSLKWFSAIYPVIKNE